MASIRDLYKSAKSKITGAEEELEGDFSEEDFDEAADDLDSFEDDFSSASRTPRYNEDDLTSEVEGRRSRGLDSLFSSTAKKPERTEVDPSAQTQSFEPVARTSRPLNRKVAVISPDSYEEAEVVGQSLRNGHVVIIDLRRTAPQLATRFLDFSFGATAALNGKVDVLQDQVYAISVGEAITATEIERVRKDGLL